MQYAVIVHADSGAVLLSTLKVNRSARVNA